MELSEIAPVYSKKLREPRKEVGTYCVVIGTDSEGTQKRMSGKIPGVGGVREASKGMGKSTVLNAAKGSAN